MKEIPNLKILKAGSYGGSGAKRRRESECLWSVKGNF